MPFDQVKPRSFTASTIREHAPARSGVYGISNAVEWVYIGEAENIQAVLLGHLQEAGTDLLRRRPTGFVFEICPVGQRSDRQDRLIVEYGPICNRHSAGQR